MPIVTADDQDHGEVEFSDRRTLVKKSRFGAEKIIMPSRKTMAPAAHSELVTTMVHEHGLSIRRAWRAACLARSAFHVPQRPRDERQFIQPGKPMQYGLIERSNRACHEVRSHDSLDNIAPR